MLNIGYAEDGPADGPAVILLHRWPYDIHCFVDVAPLLASKGHRVIVPLVAWLRHNAFPFGKNNRNGQQSVVAQGIIALADTLKIQRAILGGFYWGARPAVIIAALWPERCKAIVFRKRIHVVTNLKANQQPLPSKAELGWCYQYYFATDCGKPGYGENRYEFNRLIWKTASPKMGL